MGLSNREFAERLGVTHLYIGQRYAYERDFTLDDVARVAALTDDDPSQLILEAMAA